MTDVPAAPKKGDPANEGAIAQTLLDADYQILDSYGLARVMMENWDVRWKDTPAFEWRVVMPKRYPPPSRMEMAIRVREYNRNRQFPGIPHARQIGSEVEMLLSLNPAQRRERLRNGMKTVFRLRLRGWPELGSLLFC